MRGNLTAIRGVTFSFSDLRRQQSPSLDCHIHRDAIDVGTLRTGSQAPGQSGGSRFPNTKEEGIHVIGPV